MINNNPDNKIVVLIKKKEFLTTYRPLQHTIPFEKKVKLDFIKIRSDVDCAKTFTKKYIRIYEGFVLEIVLACLEEDFDEKILEMFKKVIDNLIKFLKKNHKTIEKLFLKKNDISDEEWSAEVKKMRNRLEKRNKKLSEEEKKEILPNRAEEKTEGKLLLDNKILDGQINEFGVDMTVLDYLILSFLESEKLIIIKSFKYTRKKVSKNRKNSKKNPDSNETENNMKENDNKE